MNSAADTIAAEDDGTTVERPPLDDVMLAMDVVDTLRRRERMVARELDEHGRAEDLKQRLRRIYAQQGLDVPDHVIEQGVAALREDRFTYKPVTGGLGRRLAMIYVRRRMPKRLRILLTWTVNVVGSAVFPENTSMATGQPSGAHNNP